MWRGLSNSGMKKSLIALLVSGLLAAPLTVNAEDNRYGRYASQSEGLNQLLDELNSLIEEGTRQRAADRRFLRDLQELADRYHRPWREELLYDDFRDWGSERGSGWQVVSGEFDAEYGSGLRSHFTPPKKKKKRSTEDELASAIVGALFDSGKKKKKKAEQTTADRAEIYIPVQISNAFMLEMSLSVDEGLRPFQVLLYRDEARNSGYRLIYSPSDPQRLELHYLSGDGRSVIERVELESRLDDGNAHIIVWRRSAESEMELLLDSVTVITVSDRSYKGDFAGVALINRGGDYTVGEIALYGAE